MEEFADHLDITTVNLNETNCYEELANDLLHIEVAEKVSHNASSISPVDI